MGNDANIDICDYAVHEDTLENIRTNMVKDQAVNDLLSFQTIW